MNEEDRVITIGLITDGKYGERAYENFKRFFSTNWIEVPDISPNIMLDDGLDLKIPECDLYVVYVRHPDIILEIAELQKPLILGITPGRGLLRQVKDINSKSIGPRTMCSLEPNMRIQEIDAFAEKFGKPNFDLKVDNNGDVKFIKIRRVSPCGSSEAGAKFIQNKKLDVETLQDFALRVCHECRAPRFGHTCDKEVSGIIHILSLINGLHNEEFLSQSEELNRFIRELKEELAERMAESSYGE
ncbi:MAG: DUF166 family protein [Promethearchaeia archaeon]